MNEKPELPRAAEQPPWQWLLDKIDAAKILKVLGKRKPKPIPRELLP